MTGRTSPRRCAATTTHPVTLFTLTGVTAVFPLYEDRTAPAPATLGVTPPVGLA